VTQNTKPNSYLNWISDEESFDCEVRNYGALFDIEKPAEVDDYLPHLNPKSLEVLREAKVHKDLLENLSLSSRFQFERKGFYCLDKDSDLPAKKLVWNQIVGLVDRLKK
jgi:glutaminyl-tRNA synthetase